MSNSHVPSSGPFPPTNAALGGLPTVGVDVPVCSVFLVLYMCAAVSHMTILQLNQRRGHKFIISGLLFGFGMSRIVTMIMRIVWATHPTNIKVGIAASVFVYAGVVLLFIVNVIFAQRIVRALHPNAGWHRLFHYAFIGICVLIVLTIIILITVIIQSFFTINNNTKRIDRDISLYGQTFYCVISFLPILMVIGGLVIPRKTHVEKFGEGRFRTKIAILLTGSFLICLGACFRVGVAYAGGERPVADPAGYQSKACFFIFVFVVEIITILMYAFVRIDKRFWVPNGSKKPGDYSRGRITDDYKLKDINGQSSGEETFRDVTSEEVARNTMDGNEVDLERGQSEEKTVQPVTDLEAQKAALGKDGSEIPTSTTHGTQDQVTEMTR